MVTFLANWEILEKKNRQISLLVAANFGVQKRISTNVSQAEDVWDILPKSSTWKRIFKHTKIFE